MTNAIKEFAIRYVVLAAALAFGLFLGGLLRRTTIPSTCVMYLRKLLRDHATEPTEPMVEVFREPDEDADPTSGWLRDMEDDLRASDERPDPN